MKMKVSVITLEGVASSDEDGGVCQDQHHFIINSLHTMEQSGRDVM